MIRIDISTDSAAFHDDHDRDDGSVGDVHQVPGGFSIVVPDGRWDVSRQQAHYLANTLLHLMKRQG